jgi:hypothetical protein
MNAPGRDALGDPASGGPRSRLPGRGMPWLQAARFSESRSRSAATGSIAETLGESRETGAIAKHGSSRNRVLLLSVGGSEAGNVETNQAQLDTKKSGQLAGDGAASVFFFLLLVPKSRPTRVMRHRRQEAGRAASASQADERGLGATVADEIRRRQRWCSAKAMMGEDQPKTGFQKLRRRTPPVSCYEVGEAGLWLSGRDPRARLHPLNSAALLAREGRDCEWLGIPDHWQSKQCSPGGRALAAKHCPPAPTLISSFLSGPVSCCSDDFFVQQINMFSRGLDTCRYLSRL